jgi:hypothetical protein
MDIFNSTVALYTALKHDTSSLRIKQAIYRADEVQAQPLDFVLDIEIKAKRLLGQTIYDLFLRSVFNDNLELMPEYMRETLGREWISYGLGPDGTYRRLYYTVKNEQVRSFLKERDNNGAQIDVRGT